MVEQDMLECPFCNKRTIQALHIPKVRQEKRTTTATFGRTKSFRMGKEEYIFQSGCSSCGKDLEEVEEWYQKESL